MYCQSHFCLGMSKGERNDVCYVPLCSYGLMSTATLEPSRIHKLIGELAVAAIAGVSNICTYL